MPVVSTKFKVDGEADYKRALSQIASETKVLNSEMKVAKATFSDNANSLEALTEQGKIFEKQVANQKERVETLEAALKDATKRYGEADKRTQDWQVSLNNARAKLIQMENSLESNTEAIQNYSEEAEESTKNTAGLGDIMGSLADKLGIQLPEGLTNAANGLGNFNVKAVAFTAGIGAAVAAVVKAEQALINMTKEAAEAASKIIDLSSTTNMSTESVQRWDYVLRSAGSSMEDAQGDLSALQEKMREAMDSTSSSAELFNELGVSVTNADGTLRSVDAVMYDVVQSLSEMEDKTNRNAISSELLGGTGEKLTAIYDEQRGSLDELIARKEANGIVTDEELKQLDSLSGAMGNLQDRVDTLKTKLGAEFAPYLETATSKLSDFIAELGTNFEESGVVESFGSILESTSGLLEPLGEIAEVLMPVAAVAIEMVAAAVKLIADALTLCIDKLEEFTNKLVEFISKYADNPIFQPMFGTSTQFTGGQIAQDAFGYQSQNGGVQTTFGEGDLNKWMFDNGVVVNVDAKNVKEFNDLLNMAQKAQVEARMFGGG